MTPVPFFDLTRQYASMEKEIQEAILPLLKSQQFILGPTVADFERQFAEAFGLSRAVGVSSGTDALVLSLVASGLLRGQGVLVPSFTFFASASAVSLAGGRPVFIDIDPSSFLLTPDILDRFLREETRPGPDDRPVTRQGNHPLAGVMAVHLYGQMVDMEGLFRVARSHGLWIVEDACQAVGARHADRPPGLFSNAAAYSFFPTKNLGGAGDGGLVTTEHSEIADHLLRLRVHGSRKRYEHEEMGYNARLDALQAKILSVKLPRLSEWTARRQSLANRYNEAFRDIPGVFVPVPLPDCDHVYHQYTLRIEGEGRRDALRNLLSERAIGSEVYYPIPLHRQEAFAGLLLETPPLPASDTLCRQVISLPVFPELSDLEQERVIDAVRAFFGG